MLDLPRRELLRGGHSCPIEPRAFDLLVYLIENRHRVLSRDSIACEFFNNFMLGNGALARTVMKIREATGDFDHANPLIKTVLRAGYRFVAPVELAALELPSLLPRRRNRSRRPTVSGSGWF